MRLSDVLSPGQMRRRRDAEAVFATPEGRRLLDWMVRRFRVLGGTFDEDSRRHAFQEGERNAVLELLELASLSVSDIQGLYREARLAQLRATQEDYSSADPA